MKNPVSFAVMLLAVLFLASGTAYAFPPWSGDPGQYNSQNSCSSGCHNSSGFGSDRPGALEVTGDALLDLDAQRNDGSTRGAIPVFTGLPGETVTLTMNVLDGSNDYAVQLKRLEKAGVLGPADTDYLTGYGADATWFEQTSNPGAPVPNYFTSATGFSGTSWAGGPVPYSFDLTLDPTTPLNTYDLEFAVAGTPGFYGDQHFYLRVIPEASSVLLIGIALCGLGFGRRSRAIREA